MTCTSKKCSRSACASSTSGRTSATIRGTRRSSRACAAPASTSSSGTSRCGTDASTSSRPGSARRFGSRARRRRSSAGSTATSTRSSSATRDTSTCAAAKRAARGRPIVFNPLVSLADTLVSDRGRFAADSRAAQVLRAVDRAAFRAADLVVADTAAQAAFFEELGRATCRGLLRRRGGTALHARLAAAGRVHVSLRRQADPAARARDDPRGGAAGAGASLPRRRQRTARAAARRAAGQRRVARLGRVRAAARRAARLRLRARHLRHVAEGAARHPEQGVPGAGVRRARRHRGHACRARAPDRRGERAARPAGRCRTRSSTRCGGSPRTPSSRDASPREDGARTSGTRARRYSANDGAR